MINSFEKSAQRRGLDLTLSKPYKCELAGQVIKVWDGRRYQDGLVQLIFEMCQEFYERGIQDARNPD